MFFSRKGLLGTMLTTSNVGTSCDLFISCLGNPLEQCGCRQYFNQTKELPLVADVANLGKNIILEEPKSKKFLLFVMLSFVY
jgi:hypothetical protein